MIVIASVVLILVAISTAPLAATAGLRTTARRRSTCGNEVTVALVVVMVGVVATTVAALPLIVYSSGSCIGSSMIVFVVTGAVGVVVVLEVV